MTKETRFILIILAVSGILFFYGTGNFALTDPDETFYAETAREMLDADEWVTPLIFGQPQFEKPALYYWLVMLSYKAFGVNEFAARLPSAVFALAGLLGVYALGRIIYSPLCGFLSALVLGTCMQYVTLGRACVTDMVLTVFILLCLLFFLRGWSSGRRTDYVVASAMAAMAVLTKGPIGLFLPGSVILVYYAFSRRYRKIREVPLVLCAVVFLAISMPWYIMVAGEHGTNFVDEFLGLHNVVRFLEPEHRIGTSPLFYVPIVLAGLFPWTVFLPMGMVYSRRDRREQGARIEGSWIFLMAWFLVVFLFFSASSTKLVTYIFPLFPALAVFVGRFWEKAVTAPAGDIPVTKQARVSFLAFLLTSVLSILGLCVFVNLEYPFVLKGTVIASAVFASGLMISSALFSRGRRLGAFYAIVLSVTLMMLPITLYIMPVIEEQETTKPLADAVNRLAAPDEPLGGEDDWRRGLAFYTGRTDIVDIHPYQSLKDFVARPERVWCVIQEKHYDQLAGDKPGTVSVPLFKSGEYVVVTNDTSFRRPVRDK